VTVGRLRKRADFLRLARARRTAAGGLVLQAAPTPEDSGDGSAMRVGFTASKKVGNAVVRNRAKRRLRALVREVLADSGTPGHDFVLIARQTTPSRPYAELRRDLLFSLKRLGLLQPEARP